MKENANPYAAPQPDIGASIEPNSNYRRQQRFLMFCMFALFAVSGTLYGCLPINSGIRDRVPAITVLLLATLTMWWYDVDQMALRQPRSPLYRLMLLICPGPLVMLPIHLLRTRGARGLLSTALAGGYLAFLLATGWVGTLIGFGLNRIASNGG